MLDTKSSEYEGMQTNGGPCAMRKGLWEQTLHEATVYLAVDCLLVQRDTIEVLTPEIWTSRHFLSGQAQKQWRVSIAYRSITVHHVVSSDSTSNPAMNADPSVVFYAPLSNEIDPSISSWSFEEINDRAFLTLHLFKKPPLTGLSATEEGHIEQTGRPGMEKSGQAAEMQLPGCEWWERVFQGDEAIDRLTCRAAPSELVGAALPLHARMRAEREFHRFASLSQNEQQTELAGLAAMRRQVAESLQHTAEAVIAEDKAVAEVPQRAEMLEVLRSQFPQIDFTAK